MTVIDYVGEHLIELKELSPYLCGRITVYASMGLFNSDIDIITQESGKIYTHVGQVFSQESAKEAFDISFRELKLFFSKLK